jgi:hypothetical protein
VHFTLSIQVRQSCPLVRWVKWKEMDFFYAGTCLTAERREQNYVCSVPNNRNSCCAPFIIVQGTESTDEYTIKMVSITAKTVIWYTIYFTNKANQTASNHQKRLKVINKLLGRDCYLFWVWQHCHNSEIDSILIFYS